MKKIVALLGDYYHPEEWIKASLDRAFALINENEKIECVYIRTNELIEELAKHPDVVILFKENRVNPNDKKVDLWMTEEMEEAITQYVSQGGGWLCWHTGLASYSIEGVYTQMLKGYFEYHPIPHFQVKYSNVEGNLPFGTVSFEIKDEHYFVKVNKEETNIFLESESDEGHSFAGWYHPYGEGRVCCLTPAHNQEGLLNNDFIQLLAKVIEWVGNGAYQSDRADMMKQFDTNTFGPLRVSKSVVPLLMKGNSKILANISSEAASLTDSWRKKEYGYCMSKTALNMQLTILQNQLKEHGIKVLAIHPGYVKTYIFGDFNPDATIDAIESATGIRNQILKSPAIEEHMFIDYQGNKMNW